MTVLEYIIGGLLLVLAIALVSIIGLQQSKRKSGLSNSIAGNGASESYLTRNKIASKESSYKKITMILAIVFVVLILALYIIGSVDETEDTSAATSSATSVTSTTITASSEAASSEAASSEAASSEAASSEAASSEAAESSEATSSEEAAS